MAPPVVFPYTIDKYTCRACALYDDEAAAEDRDDHIQRAMALIIFSCPGCMKSSCTVETLSAHFEDVDSAEKCREFKDLSYNEINASQAFWILKPRNAPAPGMNHQQTTITSSQYLAIKREELLQLNPQLRGSLPMPGQQ